ncbi:MULTISPECIES: hypothetical protein [unclassified Methylobacterium]|nr:MULTISPECIES: hypothetical protein [unclassified Methylobacterium]MCJ2017506.1 hypothetical protein [Methylobacterium sp. E-065]
MPGGVREPRALCLYVRFLNQDIIDLNARVPVGTRAVVRAANGSVLSVL